MKLKATNTVKFVWERKSRLDNKVTPGTLLIKLLFILQKSIAKINAQSVIVLRPWELTPISC